MSDSGDSDHEFDGLRLVSPIKLIETGDTSNRPLEDVKNFEAKFTGSFLEANLFGAFKNGGFGDQISSEDDEKSTDDKEKEEFVGLDWDATRIFKNLACPENNQSENSVCVLRLHDILTKSASGTLKMTRQMINCGRLINRYSPQQRRDFGFEDPQNVKNLVRMIKSLRASTELMLIEMDDLQELINPKFHTKEGKISNYYRNDFWFAGIAATLVTIPIAVYAYRRYF
ncbi:hypothetical protein GCK72_004847 [Caenorhabditis remanei]|uniref:Uncharacterized protein n=1 Tax=Caenorhabditis remanei TaxID=31234 RepID=A0A6A5HDJ2_CAERE|nr:hypothetical protein GCK72_004847 [Caenorhabditis remanei]KAF1764896.1 hypothetical protein GCK72_004847 [Caenorhabditis remanei]